MSLPTSPNDDFYQIPTGTAHFTPATGNYAGQRINQTHVVQCGVADVGERKGVGDEIAHSCLVVWPQGQQSGLFNGDGGKLWHRYRGAVVSGDHNRHGIGGGGLCRVQHLACVDVCLCELIGCGEYYRAWLYSSVRLLFATAWKNLTPFPLRRRLLP